MTWTAKNSEGHAAPVGLAVDAVVLAVTGKGLVVLATNADGGGVALPGGFVRPDQSADEAVRAVLETKTGLAEIYLEQLGAFADPGRDPRGWIPSIAYLALIPGDTALDSDARWVGARGRHRWAYDHRAILGAALDRLEGKLWWSNIAVGALPASFTLSEARTVYEAIAGRRYDPATFARDLKATGLIEPTGDSRSGGPGRPAALYRYASAAPAWGAGRRKRVP